MSNIQIENQHNFDLAIRRGINLFLGAGFSRIAHNAIGDPLPVSTALKELLLSHFDRIDLSELDLPEVTHVLKVHNPISYNAFLVQCLHVANFDERYLAITGMPNVRIITTNVDDLVPILFKSIHNRVLHDVSRDGIPLESTFSVAYLALHGQIGSETSPPLFTSVELAAAYDLNRDSFSVLLSFMRSAPTLFWGYSVSDPGLLQTLQRLQERKEQPQPMWLLAPPDISLAKQNYYRALGAQLIYGDTDSLLDYLSGISIPYADEKVDTHKIHATLHPFLLPHRSKLPSVPIEQFFFGQEPTWDQVLDGRIPETRYVAEICNHLRGNSHCIITGIPASGKTTILMQVAKQMQDTHVVLFTEHIKPDMLDVMLELLNEERAILFVDNAADSSPALDRLLKQRQHLVVAADRTYSFQNTPVYYSALKDDIHDISELSASDLKLLFDNIPISMRHRKFRMPHMEGRQRPSLFDFIDNCLVENSLSKRYQSVMKELGKVDIRLMEILLVCSYLHSCRIPASVDVLGAYFSDDGINYSELEALLRRLSSMVVDYIGFYASTDQDYYTPRSKSIARAVIDAASNEVWKTVLDKFHHTVNHALIPRYDVFRRYAYDSGTIARGFKNCVDGEKFYDFVYDQIESPFILQQKALYLSRFKEYQKAFAVMERALSEDGYRSRNIINSSATILFEANFAVELPPAEILPQLDRSMEILEECLELDTRKVYHAIAYASQACRMWNRFRDVGSREYLRSANEWLKAEQLYWSYNEEVRRVQRDVKRCLLEAENTVDV